MIKLFTGNDINNIIIVSAEIPLMLGLPTELSLLISTFDPEGSRVQTTMRVQLSKFVWTV